MIINSTLIHFSWWFIRSLVWNPKLNAVEKMLLRPLSPALNSIWRYHRKVKNKKWRRVSSKLFSWTAWCPSKMDMRLQSNWSSYVLDIILRNHSLLHWQLIRRTISSKQRSVKIAEWTSSCTSQLTFMRSSPFFSSLICYSE